jgi:hypothetical protein
MDNDRITLVTHPKSRRFVWPDYMQHLFEPYFRLSRFNGVDKSDCIYVINIVELVDKQDTTIAKWAQQLAESGHRVLINNLWEQIDTDYTWGHYWSNTNWFWYNESLWYDQLGYLAYCPDRTYQHRAFMPINTPKDWRDQVVEQLAPDLNCMLYSYRDKTLPNDSSRKHVHWQRYFHPDWYDSTYFSLVVETTDKLPANGIPFVTEKSFKPIALHHPFQIHGAPGTLKYIQQQGFVTYNNLFDESYDQVSGLNRLLKIQQNLRHFLQEPYTAETLERIEHNHTRFFDHALVSQRIQKEIVNPLIEYAETR